VALYPGQCRRFARRAVRQTAEAENNITSVERILDYTSLPSEPPWVAEGAVLYQMPNALAACSWHLCTVCNLDYTPLSFEAPRVAEGALDFFFERLAAGSHEIALCKHCMHLPCSSRFTRIQARHKNLHGLAEGVSCYQMPNRMAALQWLI